jgi:CHAT domain-containing protein
MVQASRTAGLPSEQDMDDYGKIAKNIYSRIWKPLKASISGKDMVFIAPDAGLTLISFATLPDDDDRYLIEKTPIHYLAAGRDLIRLQEKDETGIGLFALGDPDFDAPVEKRMAYVMDNDMSYKTGADYFLRNSVPDCDNMTIPDVPALPLSRYEVEQITNAWNDITGEPVTTLYDSNATEDRFKSDGPGCRVIHLATHGYYINKACYDKRNASTPGGFIGDHPLLLSGLLLAGSNLRGAGIDTATIDDGILTAYEISSMDLTGVEMVVLSACETGLGSVEEGEGVYGLRRAFQMAGARSIISSLWAVSDRHTALFMSELYRHGGESLPIRMRQLQLSKLDDLRSKNLSDHPVTWGAFVVYGAWE